MPDYIADWTRSCFRGLAYDSHIPDNHEDFLSRIDPEYTADVLSKAGIQMLQLHAKSHWGLSLHPTKVGKQHPNLHGRDYFGELVDALKRKDIKCMAYLSDFWDNYAGTQHPQWRHVSLQQSKGILSPQEEWITLCTETPYRQYFLDQIEEVLENYPVDGIFNDMTGFFGYCYCDNCKQKFKVDTGLDIPEVENWSDIAWRTFIHWRYSETERFMKERWELVHRINSKALFCHNYHGNFHHYYILSHNTATAHANSDYLTTETSPWSAYFGMYGPSQQAKFARDSADGKPFDVVGSRNMTGHDFTEKTDLELSFDAYSAVVNNSPYMIIESINWDGLPIKRDFDAIGKAFQRIKGIESWLLGSEPVRYAGILSSRASMDMYTTQDPNRITCEINAAYKTCIEKHLPVGFLFDELIDFEHLSRYKTVILPDSAVLDERQCDEIRRYVADGGGLVAIAQASLIKNDGSLKDNFGLSDVFGCDAISGAVGSLTWMSGVDGDDTGIASALAGSMLLFKEKPTYVPIKKHDNATVVAERYSSPFDNPSGLQHSSHSEPPYRNTGENLIIANK